MVAEDEQLRRHDDEDHQRVQPGTEKVAMLMPCSTDDLVVEDTCRGHPGEIGRGEEHGGAADAVITRITVNDADPEDHQLHEGRVADCAS